MKTWNIRPALFWGVGVWLGLVGGGLGQDDGLAPGLGLRPAQSSAAAPQETVVASAAAPSVRKTLVEALSAMQADRHEDALAGFRAVVQEDPANRVARMNIPVVLIRLFRHQEAREVTEELLERYPRDPAILNNASWLYATASDPALRDSRKAVRLAREALLLLPSNYHVWSTLAEAYHISGEFDKSLQAAEEALRLASSADATFEILMEYRAQIKRARTMRQAFTLVE